MATITEDYVSFEIAKLLKEKGFNAEIDTYYSPEGKFKIWCPKGLKSYLDNKGTETWWWKCIAPTLQMARKWLEEVHGIHLNIIYNKICDKGYWGKGHWTWNNEEYNSYEQACESAIKYCLENLI